MNVILLIVCLTCLVFGAAVAPVLAQEPTSLDANLEVFHSFKDSLPFDYVPPIDATRVASFSSSSPSYQSLATDAERYEEWTLLVGYAPSETSWEIVSVRPDGRNLRWLTQDGVTDVRPALNREANRIVFTSYRSGNTDIFSMNRDGGDLRQLTSSPASDDFAVWLPNSQQIMFSSNRSGRWAVYTMDADGSNQIQIMADPNADLIYPSISPSGDKLAVIKRQNRVGQVWVKYLTDTSAFAWGETCDYMQHLTWVTDQMLLLDCDGNRDYMNEIASLSLLERNLHFSGYNNSPLSEVWVGGTYDFGEMTGGYVPTVVHVDYVVVGQNISIQRLHSRLSYGYGDYIHPWVVLNSWQKSDWTPPISSIVSREPIIYRRSNFELFETWAQIDPEVIDTEAGVKSYRVEYRRNGGEWQDSGYVYDYSPNSVYSARISVAVGDFVEMRTFAEDYAGNVESGGEKVPATVSVYRAKLQGNVTDRRGVPLVGLRYHSAQLDPPDGVIDEYGRLIASIKSEVQTDITFENGALASHTESIEVNSDSWYEIQTNIVLSPPGNLLLDGGFEGSGLVDWQPVPSNAAKQYAGPYEGLYSLRLGPIVDPNYPDAKVLGRYSITTHLGVPMQLPNPTLFFVANYEERGSLTDQNRFSVEIDDGNNVARPFELTRSSNGWHPYSVSLYAWKGKEITVTLSVDVTEEIASVNLDNMQVASWDTPLVWASSVELTSALRNAQSVGGETKIVILGENFMEGLTASVAGLPLQNVQLISPFRIEGEADPEVGNGIHDVIVTNPNGLSAVRRAYLTIGNVVYIPHLSR